MHKPRKQIQYSAEIISVVFHSRRGAMFFIR